MKTNDLGIGSNPKSKVFQSLWKQLIEQDLREFIYGAEMANLTFHMIATDQGLVFYFTGYASNLGKLINSILQKFKDFDPKNMEELFESKRDTWLKAKKNLYLSSPVEQVY